MKLKLKNKRIILIAIIIAVLVFFAVVVGIYIKKQSSNPFGDRCSDRDNYEISSKKIKKIEDKFKEIEEVKGVDVSTKLCTIKIIVDLKNDVDLNIIKDKATEVLAIFSQEELNYYDFALYVTSANKDSEVYPINVSKHNSRENFAW